MQIKKSFRFATAGSVDDGKSTLIGRLLYDLDQLKTDQIEALHKDGELNLAFATDGLMEERAKGITIDVAYRYFTGFETRFICVDAPGHEEYLKNAFTAFTQVEAVVLLVDAIIGIRPQLKRHLAICQMLQIPLITICINKLDAVTNPEARYYELIDELNLPQTTITLPISALRGDNVAIKSSAFSWYGADTLIEILSKAKYNPTPYPHIAIQAKQGNSYQATLEGSTELLNGHWLNCQTGRIVELKNTLVNGKTEWPIASGNGLEPIAISFNSNEDCTYLVPEGQSIFSPRTNLLLQAFWLSGIPRTQKEYLFNVNGQNVNGVISQISTSENKDSGQIYFYELEITLNIPVFTLPYAFGSALGRVSIIEESLVVAGAVVA
jgi:signal recognition particle receptor subunit beta